MVKGILNKGATITADNVYQPHIYDEGGITDTVSEHIADIIAEKQSDIDEEIFSHAVYQTYTRETEDDPDEVDFSAICEGNKTAIVYLRNANDLTSACRVTILTDAYQMASNRPRIYNTQALSYAAANGSRSMNTYVTTYNNMIRVGMGRTSSSSAALYVTEQIYSSLICTRLKNVSIKVTQIPIGTTVYLYTV